MDQQATTSRRVVVKISGEALGGADGTGLDPRKMGKVAAEVVAAKEQDVALAVMVGGGNLLRGAELATIGFDRVTADQMGMLATAMNALALREALENLGVGVEVLAAHAIATVAQGYSPRRMLAAVTAGKVVVLAGGTGNALFTTDTAACLRAIEIGADMMVKGTKVDGVYAADPVTNPTAKRFNQITFAEVIAGRLGVMDLTAAALCEEHQLPVVVCDVAAPGALTKAVGGAKVGTRIVAEAKP